MEQQSMTALICAFARWYHVENNATKVFDDSIAGKLLSAEEKVGIAKNMCNGISFFNPAFKGSDDETLRWVVDNLLSPTVLGRAAFAETHLENAVALGTTQYLILAAGYDSFGYRQPDWARALQIFEMDHPLMVQDMHARVETANIAIPDNVHCLSADFNDPLWLNALIQHPLFRRNEISFCSLLGISYYLAKTQFDQLIQELGTILPKESRIVFDYPDQDTYTEKGSERAKKQAALAKAANESMLSSYSLAEVEVMLARKGFCSIEHIIPETITAKYFKTYNESNSSHQITALDNMNYCLAIKQ